LIISFAATGINQAKTAPPQIAMRSHRLSRSLLFAVAMVIALSRFLNEAPS
jgi:hypothetical protein